MKALFIAMSVAAALIGSAASAASVETTSVEIAGESIFVPGFVVTTDAGDRTTFTSDAVLKGRSTEGNVTVVSGVDVFNPDAVASWAQAQMGGHFEVLVTSHGRLVHGNGANQAWELANE